MADVDDEDRQGEQQPPAPGWSTDRRRRTARAGKDRGAHQRRFDRRKALADSERPEQHADRDGRRDHRQDVDHTAAELHPVKRHARHSPVTRRNHSASSITSTPCLRASLSFEPAPGPATSRSVFFETEPATLAPSRSAMALASSRVMRSSAPVKTTVLPATGDDVSTASSGVDLDLAQQRVDHLDIVRLGEEIDDGLGDDVADPADIVEVADRPRCRGRRRPRASRRESAVDRAIGARQQPRSGFADVADAERSR